MKAAASSTARRMSSSAFSRLKALRTFRRDRNLNPHSVASLLRRTSSGGPRLFKSRKDTTIRSSSCANSSASSPPELGSSHPKEDNSSTYHKMSDKSYKETPRSSLAGSIQGRRTSGRQRKPSCRLNFDGSTNNGRMTGNKKASSSSSCSSSSSGAISGHSSDRVKASSPTQRDSSSVVATDKKTRVNLHESIPPVKINGDKEDEEQETTFVRIERCSVVLQKSPTMPVLTRMSKLKQTQQLNGLSDDIISRNNGRPLQDNGVSRCYCRKEEQVFADGRSICGEDDQMDTSTSPYGHSYCQAIDLIDGRPIGCTRISSKDLQLRRVSARGVFMLLCNLHQQRLQLHHCCPFCEEFCTQGEDIIMCEASSKSSSKDTQNNKTNGHAAAQNESKEYHFFHKSCSIQEIQNSVGGSNGISSEMRRNPEIEVIWGKICCPHCGAKGRDSLREVMLEMSGSRPPIYMDEKPQCLMDVSSATFSSDVEGSKSATIKFLTDNFSQAIQEACDKARSTAHRSLSPLSVKHAIEQKNLSEFIAYLAHDGDPFHVYEESNGESLAHIAVRSRELSFLHVLYTCIEEHGKGDYFPLDIPDHDGLTPLVLGVQLNEINIVKYLLACGANFQVKTSDGSTILHTAATEGNIEMVESLLSFVNSKILQDRNQEGMTALGVAAKEGKSEIVKILSHLYSSLGLINDSDNLSRTPLHWAAQNSSVPSVVTLVKNGAQLIAKDIDGNTPLHLAILSDSESSEGNALSLLINRSDPFVENDEGHTALDYCKDWDKKGCSVMQRKKKEFLLRVIESNESIKKLEMDSTSNLRILYRDISKGKEKNYPIPYFGPVAAQNETNSLISNFTYITSFVSENPTLRPDLNITNTHRCTCDSNSCSTSSYNCCIRGDGLHYLNKKLVIPEGIEKSNLIVYECNDFCSCEVETCTNRVVQKGLGQSLDVFVKDNSNQSENSFRVRAKRFIERGSFVCELLGELVLSSDINLRLKLQGESDGDGKKKAETKIFELYESEEKFKILVDCQKYGNVCKFMNTSSTPNLIPVKIFVEHSDPRFPRVALFAKKDILAGEELTYG